VISNVLFYNGFLATPMSLGFNNPCSIALWSKSSQILTLGFKVHAYLALGPKTYAYLALSYSQFGILYLSIPLNMFHTSSSILGVFIKL
jgi:hypothetical protein